jgi:hypothetical protein
MRNFVILYFSRSVIRMIRSRRISRSGHVACVGEEKNACRILVGDREGKSQLRRSRRRWVDNIKMVLKGRGLGGMAELI